MLKRGKWTRPTAAIVALAAAYLHSCATFLSATLAHAADDVTLTARHEEGGQPQPVGIVIMAQGRSGSTMLGETFRQNKVCPSREIVLFC